MKGNPLDKKQKYHPDILLFLWLIPFISAFNYSLTYSNIQWNGFLLMTYTIDTVQGYLAWLCVRWMILFLDQKVPYEPKPLKRILIQIFFTTAAGLTFIIVTTELISLIVKGESAHISFYTLDVLIISIWFFVINGIYIGLHYQHAFRSIQAAQKDLNDDFIGFQVRQGKQEFLIKPKDTAFLKVEDQYILLGTKSGKNYLLDGSLDTWEKIVPKQEFFRLNRQTLIHRDMVEGFTKLENGKLQAHVFGTEESHLELGISRIKAPLFRSWFLQKS